MPVIWQFDTRQIFIVGMCSHRTIQKTDPHGGQHQRLCDCSCWVCISLGLAFTDFSIHLAYPFYTPAWCMMVWLLIQNQQLDSEDGLNYIEKCYPSGFHWLLSKIRHSFSTGVLHTQKAQTSQHGVGRQGSNSDKLRISPGSVWFVDWMSRTNKLIGMEYIETSNIRCSLSIVRLCVFFCVETVRYRAYFRSNAVIFSTHPWNIQIPME